MEGSIVGPDLFCSSPQGAMSEDYTSELVVCLQYLESRLPA